MVANISKTPIVLHDFDDNLEAYAPQQTPIGPCFFFHKQQLMNLFAIWKTSCWNLEFDDPLGIGFGDLVPE